MDVSRDEMTIEYNNVFKQLLTEYDLPVDLSFEVHVPAEVQRIIDDDIVITDLRVTLKS
jgi:hypothetical protein